MAPTSTPAQTETPVAPTSTHTVVATPVSVSEVLPAECGILTGFEEFGTWKRGQEDNGTLSQGSSQAHAGSNSAELTYDFRTPGNDYVVFRRTLPLGPNATALTAWVFGDRSGHYLNAWISDADERVWQFTFGRVTHTGWAEMTAPIDTGLPWPAGRISGPEGTELKAPLQFRSFVLDDAPDDYSGSGTIYLDELACADAARLALAPSPAPVAPAEAATLAAVPTARPPASESSGAEGDLPGHLAYTVFKPNMSKLTYDLYVSRLDGSESQLVWSWARQPRFRRWDGRLIFNADGQGKDNLWSVNLDGSDPREVSTHPEDSHPSWSPRGDRLLFDSEFYAWGQSAAQRVWTVWRNDTDQKGIEPQSVEVAGRVIMGRSPIWLENDWVVYNGCNYWENNGSCGLYTAPSWGADRARQITTGADDIATDALGSRITYMSRLDGNWEVYSVGFEGGDAANLTRNPANDGLATVSPDGSKIAFISDRSGAWSVWVMNADGSNPVRMFDLPGPVGPDWTTERMSWGP